jgi:uncharacterized membrane protein
MDTIKKVYNDRTILAGTFLGGPLAAGYFISENFKIFNESDKVKITWIVAILTTILLLTGLLLIHGVEKIPVQLIPFCYTIITYFLVKHFQRDKIKDYVSNEGPVYSIWRVSLIGIVSSVITILPVFIIVYFTNPILTTSTKTYCALHHEILYNKPNISEAEVDKVAIGLTRASFFDEVQKKSIFLQKVNNSFEISIPVIDNAWDKAEAVSYFVQLRKDMQAQFLDKKIVINLCLDTDISNVKKRIE